MPGDLFVTNIVWTYHTFKSILEIKHKFTIHLKESCVIIHELRFSFNYILKNAVVRKILPKLCVRHLAISFEMSNSNLRFNSIIVVWTEVIW